MRMIYPCSFTSTAIGSLDDGLGNSERESHGATVLHSVFNVVNLFMGVGLLSLPYAIHLGGWAAAAALVIVTVLFGYSGQLIVAGFQKVCAPWDPMAHSLYGEGFILG